MLIDSFSRKITYLRLSVTDRCNLRCVYCLPEIYNRFSSIDQLLTDKEVVQLVSNFSVLGVSKLRITGGEPLLRPGIVGLINRLSSISGLDDISLSTNGLLLKKMARDLAGAGLRRVNVSLDSMLANRFQTITRFGTVSDVFEGLEAAREAGLSPIKINVVVMKGVNDDEISSFIDLTEDHDYHVRFIELMPMGETGFFSQDRWFPYEEIKKAAGPLIPLSAHESPLGFGPARYFKRLGAKGTIGIIGALSCGFCSSCNRVRLTSTGTLVPCLDSDQGFDLRKLLRSGASDEALREAIQAVIQKKPEHHAMVDRAETAVENPRFMCQVGG